MKYKVRSACHWERRRETARQQGSLAAGFEFLILIESASTLPVCDKTVANCTRLIYFFASKDRRLRCMSQARSSVRAQIAVKGSSRLSCSLRIADKAICMDSTSSSLDDFFSTLSPDNFRYRDSLAMMKTLTQEFCSWSMLQALLRAGLCFLV